MTAFPLAIKVWQDLPAAERQALLQRPALSQKPDLTRAVSGIIDAVRRDGDAALRRLTEKYDGVALESIRVPDADMAAAPWAGTARMFNDERLNDCTNVMEWIDRNIARPATARAISLAPG